MQNGNSGFAWQARNCSRFPRRTSVEHAVRAFEARPEVLYAEPNWIYRAAATPNDPRYAELWGLSQSSDADIDAPEAWDDNTGSGAVTVAVADTGIAYDHPDLAPNMWTNAADPVGGGDNDANGFVDDVRGWDFIDNDNDPRDLSGHGTHVAGTIGARGHNGLGVTGVNWNVGLMAVRVLGEDGGTNASVTNGFDYAGDMGADVVNASLGGGGPAQAMKDAIDAHGDTLYVVSAGNGGFDGVGDNNDFLPQYPCNYTSANLICVAATGETDVLTGFSNYGVASVDLAAPGAGRSSAPGPPTTRGSRTDSRAPASGRPAARRTRGTGRRKPFTPVLVAALTHRAAPTPTTRTTGSERLLRSISPAARAARSGTG